MSHSNPIDPTAQVVSADLWDALLSTVLLGTEGRAGASFPGEQVLLDQLTLHTAARRAGFIPPAAARPLPTPAPAEMRAACRYETALRLKSMASVRQSAHQHATDTAILMLAERGKRLHPVAISTVMESYTRRSRDVLRPLLAALLPVLGERGRWLAENDWIKDSAKKLYADPDTPLPITYADDDAQAEAQAMTVLSEAPTLVPADKVVLAQRRRAWREPLTRLVLAKLEQSLVLQNPYEAIQVLFEVMPMFPADLLLRVQARITANTEVERRFQYPLAFIYLILPLYQELEHE